MNKILKKVLWTENSFLFKCCVTLSEIFSFLSLIFKSINTSFCTMFIIHRNIDCYLHCNRIITIIPRDYAASKYLIARYINFIFQTKYGFKSVPSYVSFDRILKIVIGSILCCFTVKNQLKFYQDVCSVVLVFQLFGLRLSHNMDRPRITDLLYLNSLTANFKTP